MKLRIVILILVVLFQPAALAQVIVEVKPGERDYDVELQELTVKWDRNKNGRIDRDERRPFVRDRAKLSQQRFRATREEMKRKADKNKDGLVSAGERSAVMLESSKAAKALPNEQKSVVRIPKEKQ